MRWSVERPDDPALLGAPTRPDGALAGLRVLRILRHRPGTRLDVAAVDASGERLVVSWHAERHAIAEAGRVRAWHDAGVGGAVPAWATVADAGRIGLTAWVPGTALDRLDDGAFVLGAWSAGEVLRWMHSSGAALDRRALAPRDGVTSEPVPTLGGASPSHVTVCDGVARWYDVGGSIMAPALVDLGRFVTDLRERADRRDADVVQASIDAFLDGYGLDAPVVDTWLDRMRSSAGDSALWSDAR